MCWRWAALFSSTSMETVRMHVAMWFVDCIFRICSSSAPGMFCVEERRSKVGRLAWVASCA